MGRENILADLFDEDDMALVNEGQEAERISLILVGNFDGEIKTWLTASNCDYDIIPNESKLIFQTPIVFTKLKECGGAFTPENADDFITQCELLDEGDLKPADWLHYGTALAWLKRFDESKDILEKALDKAHAANKKAKDPINNSVIKIAEKNLRLAELADNPLPILIGPTSKINFLDSFDDIEIGTYPDIKVFDE